MSSLGPSGPGAHGFQLNQAGIRRNPNPYSSSHQSQPSKPSPASHSASTYQPQYPPHNYAPQLFPQVNGNVPSGNSRGPAPHALGQRQRPAPPGRQQMPQPQPQQPNPSPMMFGSMSQSLPHDPIMAHQHQQQHQGQPPHQGHPGQQHQGHQAHQQHQGQQHPSYPTQQQQQQPQSNQQQQTHMQQQRAQQQQQQQLQHQHHAQQQHQHQVTPPQHMAHQPPPHQQPQHHQQQQPTPQHQHRQQPQPQMPHQQPKQTIQQQPAPSQQQPPQAQPQLPQAQTQPQILSQIQLQPQAPQPNTGRGNHTPQQKAPQPPTPQPPPQAAQSQPVQQQAPKDVDVMDIDDSREGDSEVPLDVRIHQDPSFQPTQPMGEMMSPPPEGGSYPTLEAVQKAVLRYCTSVGYAIVIGRSKKTVPGLKKVLFVCDRAGKPPNKVSPEHRKRKTSSRKCDCPFGFFAIEQRTQWTIRYRPDERHKQHNHGPSDSPTHHPAARKLDSKMVAAVKELKENGAGVSETLQILQNQNPDCHLLPRDIYNARAAINRAPPKPQADAGGDADVPDVPDESPTIYAKQPQTNEDKIRSELRSQLSKAREDLKKVEQEKQKEIDSLKNTIKEKDEMINRFEMFIDICNQRVMVQRERLSGPGEEGNALAAARIPG